MKNRNECQRSVKTKNKYRPKKKANISYNWSATYVLNATLVNINVIIIAKRSDISLIDKPYLWKRRVECDWKRFLNKMSVYQCINIRKNNITLLL